MIEPEMYYENQETLATKEEEIAAERAEAIAEKQGGDGELTMDRDTRVRTGGYLSSMTLAGCLYTGGILGLSNRRNAALQRFWAVFKKISPRPSAAFLARFFA